MEYNSEILKMSTKTLNPPSEEQQLIIDVASTLSSNVTVDSVAGSGKTTLILHICKTNPNIKVLVITYNKDLKSESRERAASLGIENIEIHTYHSLCWRYYGSRDYTDNGIEKSIFGGIKLQPHFDLVVLDESQDITPLLYKLFVNFYKSLLKSGTPSEEIGPDFKRVCPIMLIGDKFQTIYGFRGADSRYLTHAENKYNLNSLPWAQYTMSKSFRITQEMAKFINNAMIKQVRLIGRGSVPGSVIYMRTDTFKTFEIAKILRGHTDSEIMILAPSIKSQNSPVRKMANYLSELGRKLYVPINDDAVPDMREATGKIVCMTIHQSKGLEREVVLVYGFDDTYFKYFAKSSDPEKCPNTLYVACTRAKKLLVMIQHDKNDPLTFLNLDEVSKCATVRGGPLRRGVTTGPKPEKTRNMSVTQLVSHLSFDAMREIKKFFVVESLTKAGDTIKVPDTIEMEDGSIEGVSDITGTAVMMYLADKIGCVYPKLDELRKKTSNMLHIANIYNSEFSGYIHKLNQIPEDKYDWFPEVQVERALKRGLELLELNNNSAKFETMYSKEIFDVCITGCVDLINVNKLYEIKFVEKLQDEHFLQTAVYMYLTNASRAEYRTVNIKNGEVYRIHATPENLTNMIETILYYKNRGDVIVSDAEFLGTLDERSEIFETSSTSETPSFSQELFDELIG